MTTTIERVTKYATFDDNTPEVVDAVSAQIWDLLRNENADPATLTFSPAPEEHFKRSDNVTALVFEYDRGSRQYRADIDDLADINAVNACLRVARDNYRADR
jgi:hypothetical protein